MEQSTIGKSIGQRVRGLRDAARFSRKRLAEAAGVSERYLADLETGQANASVGLLARLAGALSVDIADFLPPARGQPGSDAASRSVNIVGPLAGLIAGMSEGEQRCLAPVVESWLDHRRRNRKGIALLGLRGAGKTTLGSRLAERHNLQFVSITREIEARAGLSLAELFNLGGPEGYRALENEVVADFVRRNDRVVLETAGGIVGNGDALAAILGAYTTVWIQASPEAHLARVAEQGDMRPMHGNPRALDHLKALLTAREPDYARAECRLDTTGRTIEDCLADLDAIIAPILDVQAA